MSKPTLGSGQRFKQLESKLAQKPGVEDPKALAAPIGRRKLGAQKMNQLAQKGRSRAAKARK